jgi:hypothetical protein
MPTNDLVLSVHTEYKRLTAVNASPSVYGNGSVKRTGTSRVMEGRSFADSPAGPSRLAERGWSFSTNGHRVLGKRPAQGRVGVPSRHNSQHERTFLLSAKASRETDAITHGLAGSTRADRERVSDLPLRRRARVTMALDRQTFGSGVPRQSKSTASGDHRERLMIGPSSGKGVRTAC